MNEFLKSLAPLLGNAIAGPLGGVAASFIADKLGLSESTVEVVSDVLNSGKMTAEQVSNVKLAEIDFKRFLESNKIDMEKIAVDNTKSAREMQIVTKSAFPAILSTFITVGFFGILGWMLYDDSITNSEPILIMLGSLGAAFGAVCNYWLGSSKSSGEYRQLLAQK
jgi:hypothetical protein